MGIIQVIYQFFYSTADESLFSLQDAFIGFGGVVIRERVRREAKWFVTSFRELIDELPVANGVHS